jgi:hypothetical protein
MMAPSLHHACTGEYSWEWGQLRRLQRRILRLVVAGVGVFVLVVPTDKYLHLGLLFSLVWVIILVAFVVTLIQYSYWPCPRCGQPFHYRRGALYHLNNPFANQCIQCSLPKWAMSDPNQKLKKYHDPFRTDLVFRLGDSKRTAVIMVAELQPK